MCSSSRIGRVFLLALACLLCQAKQAASQTIEAMVYYTQTSSSGPSTCNTVAKYDGVNQSGTTQLIALSSGQKIYICGYTIFSPSTTAVAQLVYGTGTNCATGQSGLTPAYQLTAQKPIIDGRPFVHGLQTASGQALCLIASSVNSGYTYYRSITISYSKVSTVNNTNLTNFPVLISGAYSYLATTANSGVINNTATLNGHTVPAD